MQIKGLVKVDVDPVTFALTTVMNTGYVFQIQRMGVGVYELVTQSFNDKDVVALCTATGDPFPLGGAIVSLVSISNTVKQVRCWAGAPMDKSFQVVFISKF